jgi:hypothetical protein
VLPDGAVMTQTESASPDLVAVPQYRTEVRRVEPSNGLLAGPVDPPIAMFPNRGHASCTNLAR